MVYTTQQKDKQHYRKYKVIHRNREDLFSIDSNELVNDETDSEEIRRSHSHENAPVEIIQEVDVVPMHNQVSDASSIDSFEKKHVPNRMSKTLSKTSSRSIPHFMLPTEASIQRDQILFEEKQRKSIAFDRKKNVPSDPIINKPKAQPTVHDPPNTKYSHLPRFMQPTQSYLQSLQPEPNQWPRKSIPSARIREVNTSNLPRYMRPTKASLYHLNSEQKKQLEESSNDSTKPREFVEPLFRKQPLSSHDEVAINELRRELEKTLTETKRDLRLSSGETRCTAIKKREGDVENEEEVNERVRQAMKKVYPRFMKMTEAYRQKYNIKE